MKRRHFLLVTVPVQSAGANAITNSAMHGPRPTRQWQKAKSCAPTTSIANFIWNGQSAVVESSLTRQILARYLPALSSISREWPISCGTGGYILGPLQATGSQ